MSQRRSASRESAWLRAEYGAPMFSVIIPCYENRDVLKKTLAGFAVQTCTGKIPFEVILVDNRPATTDVIEAHSHYFRRLDLYLIRLPSLRSPFSLCRARNAALRLARHEWIVSMDSDCIPNKHHLANLARHVKRKEKLLVTGERVFVSASACTDQDILDDPGALERLPQVASVANYHQVKDRRFPGVLNVKRRAHPWSYIHAGNAAYRRADALAVGGFDEDYDGCWGYEDIYFAYRLIAAQGCEPNFLPGLETFHQEPEGEHTARSNRFDKASNPNWKRICAAIPGYKKFKERQYRKINASEIIL